MDLEDKAASRKAIEAVLAGEVDAYRPLVIQHSPRLFRVAFRITGREEDADEVVQEALLKGYRNLASLESDALFGTWIYRITVNCAYDLIARRERIPQQPTYDSAGEVDPLQALPDLAAGPERLALSGELREAEQFALNSLTALERTAFLLRHVEGQSSSEIGEALQMAPNAIKQAIFRAVQKLRRRLAPFRGGI